MALVKGRAKVFPVRVLLVSLGTLRGSLSSAEREDGVCRPVVRAEILCFAPGMVVWI
jgi:hypothetical protein